MGLIKMRKSTGILLSATMLLLGIILGFLLSPIKGGLSIGNNSGNGYLRPDETDSGDEIPF